MGREGEDLKRAKVVACLVRGMQAELEDRVKEHKNKAAPAARWIKDREEGRGLMRAVLRAWAHVRGSANMAAPHMTDDEWRAWRDAEPKPQRDARRRQEAVMRITTFAKTCFNKFTAERGRQKRMLRVRIAVLRKARVQSNWARARAALGKVLDKVRVARAVARWPKRAAALLPDAVSCVGREALEGRLPRPVSAGVPMRRAKLNLVQVASAGPRMRAIYPRGDG